MLTGLLLLAAVGVAFLTTILRRNHHEQRAMSEAYDQWQATGQMVPGWSDRYVWSHGPTYDPESGPELVVAVVSPLALTPLSDSFRWTEADDLRSGSTPSSASGRWAS